MADLPGVRAAQIRARLMMDFEPGSLILPDGPPFMGIGSYTPTLL